MTDRPTSARTSLTALQRYARPAITIIASLGAIETAFLTWVELNDRVADICSSGGCDTVLTSPYASPYGVPLPLFGLMAYGVMAIAALIPRHIVATPHRASNAETITSWILVIGGAIMATTSSYLMYILATQLHALCPYCIASALFSCTIFVLALTGRRWDDLGGVSFTLIIVAGVTLTGIFGVFADINPATATTIATTKQDSSSGYTGAPLTRHSDPDSIALAQHLTAIGAQQFGAYWCPHCHTQKELFGIEAFANINYIECDPKGVNPQTEFCRATGIHSYPTWKINDQLHEGIHELTELADLSGYTGGRSFKHTLANTNS
ncbi:MAG: hypothetical protein EAZ61_15010 [Oscillatoriales cyanobacterium]|nr:MAG: hypothetical protein EAZ61_15010 [Oscillatoriales cyanobacterium]